MAHFGTRQIPHDSDKENAMDINLDKQVEDNEPTSSSKYDKILNNETYDPDQDKDEKPTLDSRLLVLTSDLGVQKARRMKLDNNAFDVDAYISKLITFMGGRQVDDDNDEPDLNWSALEERDIERQENETTKNVRNIWNILAEKSPINFFEFIVNPESFGQTVENLFYLSFLVRDAKVNIDDDGACCEPPTGDDYAEGLIKKQLVMGIDMNTWKELIEVYNIRVSAIPTRQSCTPISGKWYG
ncbi:19608_t:CDS:2 [Racocetra fulgida]|uniref:Non-structural maintenance of chromosomes element 4 n=1 Tax=Racocetra fulgida TaxID=60492 RepID=A0A9N9A118_9GLOM|nr:19608_t:CDS:2 [Racocetra fulgida]